MGPNLFRLARLRPYWVSLINAKPAICVEQNTSPTAITPIKEGMSLGSGTAEVGVSVNYLFQIVASARGERRVNTNFPSS